MALGDYHACFALLTTGQVLCFFTTDVDVYNRQEYSRSASVVPASANADVIALAVGGHEWGKAPAAGAAQRAAQRCPGQVAELLPKPATESC